MSYSYYSRLTLIHPKDSAAMDPRSGYVIAETATTGRFIIGDITWESGVGPNADTTVAYHTLGEMKIFEPLGLGFFDYIKAASYKLGIENHIDARFLLEIEILAEALPETGTPFKYIWPIMILATQVKSSMTERGTEYVLKFVHTPYHGQTDMVQPIKETITVKDVGTLAEYFRQLQKELEIREYKYALARQKAGKTAAPSSDNPAAEDPYHDEYHFILEPRLEKFTLTSKGTADKAVQGSWINRFRSQKIWDVSLRPGTTIIQQINRILMQTNEIADLLPGRAAPVGADATGSSQANADRLLNQLGKVYQFFRIETHTVYKSYDFIRGRYAAKYVFFIFLADQPNMYHYPDELNLLNQLRNQEAVMTRLKYYIQEGLLRKLYYHNYTGLNTDILKVDLNFNQGYALPSFPVVWMDRGQTGPGLQNPQNDSQRVNPFNHQDDQGAARRAVNVLREQASTINAEILELARGVSGGVATLERWSRTASFAGRGGDGLTAEQRRKGLAFRQLKQREERVRSELERREQELQAATATTQGSRNTINNRSELLDQLKGQYIEDMDQEKFKKMLDNYLSTDYPVLRPRMEPDDILSTIDDPKKENEKLMEKLFAVQIAPRDIVELEIEIIGDPYWLGVPNLFIIGQKSFDKIELPEKTAKEIRDRINQKMTTGSGGKPIDPQWSTRSPVWGNMYGVAQVYKGAPLFYFLSQVPDSDFDENDLIRYNSNDQIVGIYMVKKVVNDFKEGKWTQKLVSVRDITIPSHVLPRSVTGELTFENFMSSAIASPDRAKDAMAELRRAEEKERLAREAGAKITATNPPGVNASPVLSKALENQSTLSSASRENIPVVRDPVERANELLASGTMTREQAYSQAKDEFKTQLDAKHAALEKINKQAYEQAGITNYRPYSAETMTSIAMSKGGAGGLDEWKNNTYSDASPSIFNNPMATGYDRSNNSYYRYKTFDEGLNAGNDYYNYGQNVKSFNSQDAERFLLPKDHQGSELEYLNSKLKGQAGAPRQRRGG